VRQNAHPSYRLADELRCHGTGRCLADPRRHSGSQPRRQRRTVELNGTQTITTTYSNYAPVDGAVIARKQVIDDGSGSLQTNALISGR
jgi:hypothetical protein